MIDVLIIGCGVTGAACAYTLARYDLRVAVLEAGSDVAVGTSRANSAIIHAGYDPAPGTDMARLNVRGAALAPEICARLDVPYLPCGSMVLAFDEGDRAHLQKLYDRGCANGVPGLEILSGEEARAREPERAETVVAALWAPSAGIICPWEYTLAMAETAVRNGVELHLRARVTAIERTEYGTFLVKTEDGAEYESRFVVSAAGVDAAAVRALLEEPDYRIIPTRGQYYLLDKSEGGRVGCTVFQCPNEKGKGVLVSPTVHGNLIVGPDAAVGAADDRSTDSAGLAAIAAAARRSVPGVDLRQNIRNFAGVRANSDRDDFIIGESAAYPGFIDLAGIKSPGLTAAIAEDVVEMLRADGLALREKAEVLDTRRRVRFKELSMEEKNAVIALEPAYGRVVCRCETVTEGEIVAALRSPIPPRSIGAVKRRTGAGLGRCQGGFCSPKVHELLVRELGLDWLEVCLEEPGSEILTNETKGGAHL